MSVQQGGRSEEKNTSGTVVSGHPKRNQHSTETLLTNRIVLTNRSTVKRYFTYLLSNERSMFSSALKIPCQSLSSFERSRLDYRIYCVRAFQAYWLN
jgi:hypothetical protein